MDFVTNDLYTYPVKMSKCKKKILAFITVKFFFARLKSYYWRSIHLIFIYSDNNIYYISILLYYLSELSSLDIS
jgi:hypothetical protein